MIQREWQRVDPRFLDEDEQQYWATIAGRQVRFEDRADFVKKLTDSRAAKSCLEKFLFTAATENPNRRLRLMALSDRVSMRVERAEFDDLVTIVTQAPPWEKDRLTGVRTLLRAIADGKPDAPDQILERWTWKLARATRKVQDRVASQKFPEAKRLLGALANSRGHRHEENAARLVKVAREQPLEVAVALLASAEGYTPRANTLIDTAREEIGTIADVATALAENLPAPKAAPGRKRRRRRKKKPGVAGGAPEQNGAAPSEGEGHAEGEADGEAAPRPKRRRRRRSRPAGDGAAPAPAPAAEPAAAES